MEIDNEVIEKPSKDICITFEEDTKEILNAISSDVADIYDFVKYLNIGIEEIKDELGI